MPCTDSTVNKCAPRDWGVICTAIQFCSCTCSFSPVSTLYSLLSLKNGRLDGAIVFCVREIPLLGSWFCSCLYMLYVWICYLETCALFLATCQSEGEGEGEGEEVLWFHKAILFLFVLFNLGTLFLLSTNRRNLSFQDQSWYSWVLVKKILSGFDSGMMLLHLKLRETERASLWKSSSCVLRQSVSFWVIFCRS